MALYFYTSGIILITSYSFSCFVCFSFPLSLILLPFLIIAFCLRVGILNLVYQLCADFYVGTMCVLFWREAS